MKTFPSITNFPKNKSTFFNDKKITKFRILGSEKHSLKVSPLGLGCMGMSESYYGTSNKNDCIKTIQQAYYESGITLFDTADIYGNGENEILVGEAIKEFRENIILASKFGLISNPDNPKERLVKADREYVFSACEASLKRLGTHYLDLYYLHRLDPKIPIEETVTAMAELVKQGKVRCIGLSEVNAETIRKAHKIHPITAVQTEYSLWSKQPAESIAEVCQELGIGFVAYSPLGRGMLTGELHDISKLDPADKRRNLPRFQGENFQHNLKMISELNMIAQKREIELSQLALSWLLHKNCNIVPIFGTKKYENVKKNIKSLEIELTDEEVKLIDSITTTDAVKGDRYGQDAMLRLKY